MFFTGLGLTVSAIIVADYGVAVNPPIGDWDLNWDYVYNYKNSSSVAVGEYWLLTAAHVGDDGGTGSLTIDGVNYIQQEVIFHAAVDDSEHSNKADLALVRYDKPLPGWYPLYTGSVNNKSVVMVGFGRTGTVYSTYYTETALGNGTKRWGSQKIDGTATADYPLYTGGPMTYNDGVQMIFSTILSATPYEAGVGVYDSGGGTFVQQSGIWKLAGINTTRYADPLDSSHFTGTFAVSIPAYETWLTQMIDSVTGDADSDSIPNWWEEQYGTNILAGADQDGDGFTGEQEYIADTDPTDSNSFWQVEGAITSADQTFVFDGSAARQYQLVYTTNGLADPGLTWITNGVPIWGEGSGTEITVTNTEDMVFYRVEVSLP